MTGPSVVRECTHPFANHQHGTFAKYVLDRCRCDDCREAARVYNSANRRRRIYAAHDPAYSQLVDAGPVRAHIEWLVSEGMGLKQIAKTGPIAHGTLDAIMHGKGGRDPKEHRPQRKRVRRDVAARILAIRPVLAGGAKVDPTGTVRRVRALVAIGYSQSYLGRRIGWNPANMGDLAHARRRFVQERTRIAVKAVFDELSMTQGPSARSIRLAAREGWPPPIVWDDDTIDDPNADAGDWKRQPDPAQGRPRDVVIEDFLDTHWEHRGYIPAAAIRLGLTETSLERTLTLARRDGVELEFTRRKRVAVAS